MFIAGADQNNPELRAPSIKGVMRYWWRALRYEKNSAKLHREECNLFGCSTDSARKSPLTIRIHSKNYQVIDQKLIPHKSDYTTKAIAAGTEFEVELTASKNMDVYEALLKLSFILSGVGRRSRRGFGAVKQIQDDESGKSVLQSIIDLIQRVNKDLQLASTEDNSIEGFPEGSFSYPVIKKILYNPAKKFNSWQDLIVFIGKKSKENRQLMRYNRSRKRMASPVHVSVIELDDSVIPLVTVLSTPNRFQGLEEEMDEFTMSIVQSGDPLD